jgi:hypothetical protein
MDRSVAKVLKWTLGGLGTIYCVLWLVNDHGPFPLYRPTPEERALRQAARTKELDAQAARATPAAVAASPTPPFVRIRPEDLIRFPDSAPVCTSQEALKEFMRRSLLGQETKARALFSSYQNPDAPCIMVSPKLTLKVLSVYYADKTDETGLVEVVGAASGVAEGHWALTTSAIVVSARHQ